MRAAEALSGFIAGVAVAGVAVASVACWFLRDRIRAWLPRKGATIGGVPERYGFAVVCGFAAALVVVVVFLVR